MRGANRDGSDRTRTQTRSLTKFMKWTTNGKRPLGMMACTLSIAFMLASPMLASAAAVGLRQVGTGLTTVSANAGESLDFELFLDTEGLSFEGYYLGIDITGGGVSGLGVTHESIPNFFPLFGPPLIDEGADTIRRINQSVFASEDAAAAGIYVLDIIALTIDSFLPGNEILLTPGLFGESLGLGGGSCPGTIAGCSVSFSSAVVTPEPGTGLLVMTGLFLLKPVAARRRLLHA